MSTVGSAGVTSGPAALMVDSVSAGESGGQVGEDEHEVLVIHGRTISVNKYLNSKSKINDYTQKFKLAKVEYKVTVQNENHSLLRKFTARLELEGKFSSGTGTSKKGAEAAAARRYCHNIFLGGGNSLLLGKEVSSSKSKNPSNKKRKDKLKMERFLERKRAAVHDAPVGFEDKETVYQEEAEKEDIVMPNYEVQGGARGSDSNGGPVALEVDLERAGGPDDCEIIQLGYALGLQSGSSIIMPRGKIDRVGSKLSHKFTVVGKVMKKENVEVKTETMFEAGKKILKFIQEKSAGRSVYMVCHGNDMKTLLNNMALVGLDKELAENIIGSVNSLEVFCNDEQFEDKSKSLSSLKKCKNLAEEILGDQINREELVNAAHDAEYDAILLGRVWSEYLLAWSPSPLSVVLENYMDPSSNLIRDASNFIAKIGDKRRRKMRPVQDTGVLYFNGWL